MGTSLATLSASELEACVSVGIADWNRKRLLDSPYNRYVETRGPTGRMRMLGGATENLHLTSHRAIVGATSSLLRHPPFHSASQPAFMDLGSGLGAMAIEAAHAGWRAYGIELDGEYHENALQNVQIAEEARYIPRGSVTLAQGTFFSRGLRPHRIPGDDREDPFERWITKYGNPLNGWDELGIGPSDIDFFYHFQVERRENLLSFFSAEARDGAAFALIPTMFDSFSVPANLVEMKSRFITLYMKSSRQDP